ncbi:MAG: TolC family protein [Acidobacteria bacterium]|nr:TolC family protein [Acidobacteriota bacterium]
MTRSGLTIPAGVALTLLLTQGSARGQGGQLLTLAQARRLALTRYETVQAAREQVDQARLLRQQASSAVLPHAEITSLTTRNFITTAFQFGDRRIDVLPGFDYNIALTISQPIFAGLRDRKVRDQANLGIDVAGRQLELTAQDAALEATRAYYQLLSAEENVEISRRAVAVAEETLRVADSLYRAGEAVETAVLRARVAGSEARRELLQAENGRTLAQQGLSLLIGATDAFIVARPPRPTEDGQPLEALVAIGVKSRADMKALNLQHQVAELEIEKRRGQHFPVISAEGSYVRRRASFPSNQLSSVQVRATWTLFDGGRTGIDVAAARSQLRQIDDRRELLRKQIEQQIRAAYLTIDTLGASADMLTAQVEFARKNAESTARAYRAGEATDLDVMEANQVLTRSERQLSVTAFSLDVARYELQRAVGTLPAEIGGTNSAEGAQE